MYGIYREHHPATGVEHSLYCRLLHHHEKVLVIGAGNNLKVYRLYPTDGNDDPVPKMDLQCLLNMTLSDQIVAMDSTQREGAGRDSLLLTFREAHLSVLDYDPRSHELKTTAIYNLESRDTFSGWKTHWQIPFVRVDPSNRCAVVLVNGLHLGVLPLTEVVRFPGKPRTAADDAGTAGTSTLPTTAKPSMLQQQDLYFISLKSIEIKCDTVHDMKFLSGYYEPTLFILFEPLRTWTGRLAAKHDTCQVIAISINMADRVHPVIWSLSTLPSDCQQVFPVPQPVGGTLVAGANCLIYLNQNMPPYGISMNSIPETSTQFVLQQKNEFALSLEGCKVAFLEPDRVVMSVKNGELYLVHFLLDPSRAVRSFRFDKIGNSVLTTCATKCEDGFIFLGCRLSNSLLIRYTKERMELRSNDDEPPMKKAKEHDPDSADELDDIDAEIFGVSDRTTSSLDYRYSFDLSDKLVNIGPIGSSSIGSSVYLSEEYQDLIDTGMNVEVVVTSGYGKHGALSVIQRTVRPSVVHSVQFGDCTDMFVAKGQTPGSAYLFVSRKMNTAFLAAAEDIDEIDDCPDLTKHKTLFAGDIGKYIIQVYPLGIRVLKRNKIIVGVPMEPADEIHSVSMAEPYLLLLTTAGQVLLATFEEDEGKIRLNVSRPSGEREEKVVAVAAVTDSRGLFRVTVPDYVKLAMETAPTLRKVDPDKEIDEDELLYGDTLDLPGFAPPVPMGSAGAESFAAFGSHEQPSWERLREKQTKTRWALFVRENGDMEIFTLPDCRRVFLCKGFQLQPRVLYDMTTSSDEPAEHEFNAQPDQELAPEEIPEVTEILVAELGRKMFLMAILDEDLVVYEAFPCYEAVRTGGLKLRWRRAELPVIMRTKKNKRTDSAMDEVEYGTRLRYFENIGGYSGVFVCGAYPHWIFVTKRGELRIHPQSIDGPVKCFTPFDNVNARQGFVYANKSSEVRICVLPSVHDFDAPWPVKKVNLRATPYFVNYHFESKTYAVITAQSVPSRTYYKYSGEDKELVEVGMDDSRFPLNNVQRFFLQVVSPATWELVPNGNCAFEEWEHVTNCKTVDLAFEGTATGMKGYIACSTNFSYGEDITSRGRIVIFDIISVVPEPGKPLTKHKLKVVYAKEQKGPVTALCHCKGLLCSAIGQKVYLWQLKDDDLVGIAFIDVGIYVHQCVAIKNFIMISDILKSVSVLRYQEEYRNLSMVASDHKNMEVLAVDFFIDNTQLGFLVSDNETNLTVFMYNPESRDSIGGSRLLPRCDYRVNSKVHTFFRIRCRRRDPTTGKKHSAICDKRHITFLGTLDGNIGAILPLQEKTFRRLSMLCSFMNHFVPHPAGLNPRGSRTYHSSCHSGIVPPQRNILDGDLIFRYLCLPYREKKYVAERIGLHVNDIVSDLLEIDRYGAHF